MCSSFVRTLSARQTTLDAPETDIETDIEPDTETPEQWTGRQLRQCRRMAELALQLAETAARQAQEQAQSGKKTKGPDPSLVFIRLCTTVRQSIALEARLTAGPKPARHRTAPPSPEPRPAIQPAPAIDEAPPATLLPVPKNTGKKGRMKKSLARHRKPNRTPMSLS